MLGEVRVRRLAPDDWALWRAVRLTALADAPYAYGSTLAQEQAYSEARWREWLARATNVVAVAEVGGEPVGAVGGFLPAETGPAVLCAMWVRPAARGRRVGDRLVAEVVRWAAEQGRTEVELHVADGNPAARALFLRNGFTPTGRVEPLASNPDTNTEVLVRSG